MYPKEVDVKLGNRRKGNYLNLSEPPFPSVWVSVLSEIMYTIVCSCPQTSFHYFLFLVRFETIRVEKVRGGKWCVGVTDFSPL